MPTRVSVIYYSATGNVHALARALTEGAEEAGSEIRLRRVAELAPEAAIAQNPDWARHRRDVESRIPEASLDDLEWADAFAFGTPTRFGAVSAQLKQFLDTTGGLWQEGKLADKAVTAFTSALNTHGGQETTIVSLNNVFYHWGSIIVAPGYTDDSVSAAGGNPYGTSHTSDAGPPGDAALAAARYQGKRLARIASALRQLRTEVAA